MADGVDFEDIILYLIEHAPGELSIAQLTKLAYLAEVEHQQLYGEPLSGVSWQLYTYGPFTPSVYAATELLEERGQIACAIRPAYQEMGRNFSAKDRPTRDEVLERLPPRALRVLSSVIEQMGHLTVPEIERVAYATATMRRAKQGEWLDFSHEPSRSLGSKVPGLAAFLRRAPAPNVRDLGDASESAAEDREILSEFQDLRRAANGELV